MLVIGIMTGFVTGILSGLLGIGGGAILVASAVSFMGVTQHMAQAAAIASTIPTAIVGVLNLHRKKLVNYSVAFYLAIGMAIGGVIGAYLANMLSGPVLKKIFSVFFAIMSIQMLWTSRDKKEKPPETAAEEKKGEE